MKTLERNLVFLTPLIYDNQRLPIVREMPAKRLLFVTLKNHASTKIFPVDQIRRVDNFRYLASAFIKAHHALLCPHLDGIERERRGCEQPQQEREVSS